MALLGTQYCPDGLEAGAGWCYPLPPRSLHQFLTSSVLCSLAPRACMISFMEIVGPEI